ncbi:unnamed protein product [Tenebrio molitor]|nr:unnamed protein product [Tenebrio molitor]
MLKLKVARPRYLPYIRIWRHNSLLTMENLFFHKIIYVPAILWSGVSFEFLKKKMYKRVISVKFPGDT